MPIEFRCEKCNGLLRVAEADAGRLVRCGRCGHTFRSPTSPPPAQPEVVPMALPVESVPPPAPLPPPGEAPVASGPPPSLEPPVPAPAPPPLPQRRPTAVPVAPPDKKRAGQKNRAEQPPRKNAIIHGTPGSSRERPKPQRGTLGKVKVVMGICVLAGLLLAGAGYLAWRSVSKPAQWQWHESARGGFKVELPAAPRDHMSSVTNFPEQAGMQVEGTIHRDNEYAVFWSDLPGGLRAWMTDDQVITDAASNLSAKFTDGMVTTGQPFTVSGFPARELTISADEGTYIARAVVVDTRLYMICAGGPRARDPLVARRFLDSFQITEQHIQSIQERKEAETRRAKEEAERLAELQRKNAEAEAARLAEARKRAEEAAAARTEAERKEKERLAEIERTRRAEAVAEADKFRAAQVGVSAPDPTKLPGLKLYLSFDDVKKRTIPVWPKDELESEIDVETGPGVRGRAIYFSEWYSKLEVPARLLPDGVLKGPGTVSGWVKVRKPYGFDLLRTETGTNFVNPAARFGLLRQQQGGFAAYAWVPVPRFHIDANPKNLKDRFSNSISAACPDDEKWHHVALTRSDDGERSRVLIYLDGEPVASHNFPAADPDLKKLFFGFLTKSELPVDRDRFQKYIDMPVAAADEFCLFNRALTLQEVKFLAGKAQSPAPPAGELQVRLKEHATIDAVAGVAFDLERNTVWAVTAVGGHWRELPRRPSGWEWQPAYLLKYSYPDFKLEGKWAMPSQPGRRSDMEPVAGSTAFDAKNNRIYVLLHYPLSVNNPLQEDQFGYGTFYRFDLDNLPKPGPKGEPPRLTPAAKMKDRGSGWRIAQSAVSADGEWLYFCDLSPRNSANAYDSAITRVSADLKKEEELAVPGSSAWARSVWLSPDGKTLRVVQAGKAGRGSGNAESGILEVDAATWKAGAVREVLGVTWNWSEVIDKSAWVVPVAVHPDGRVFAGAKEGVTETLYTADGATKRARPITLAPSSFMAVSGNGRFLFASEAKTTKNRLFVLDARANASQLGELAVLTETADRKVGGPIFVSPDGQFVIFRSGLVVRVDDSSTIDRNRRPQAPMPRELEGHGEK